MKREETKRRSDTKVNISFSCPFAFMASWLSFQKVDYLNYAQLTCCTILPVSLSFKMSLVLPSGIFSSLIKKYCSLYA